MGVPMEVGLPKIVDYVHGGTCYHILIWHYVVANSSDPPSPCKTRVVPLESPESVGVPIVVGLTKIVDHGQGGTRIHIYWYDIV